MPTIDELAQRLDRPYEHFEPELLGPDFAAELQTVSELWFACGYRPGIAAYLNFFLLRDFIVTHDAAFAPRFASFKAMARSFYATDLFIRAVTDSGREPTGGISSARVRDALAGIMQRHRALAIPEWMMSYFGWSLLDNVERQCAPLTADQQRLHLAYMTKTFRIMGVPFSADRASMIEFGRRVEAEHAGHSPQLERHARNILFLGEMVGVSSAPARIGAMLPAPTRAVFEPIAAKVRPGLASRWLARGVGKVAMRRAIGRPRTAVPAAG